MSIKYGQTCRVSKTLSDFEIFFVAKDNSIMNLKGYPSPIPLAVPPCARDQYSISVYGRCIRIIGAY